MPPARPSLRPRAHPSPAAPARRGARAARPAAKKRGDAPESVDYGRDWYASTRDAVMGGSRARAEMERRRAANRAANNGLERKDLYTDAWAGSEWRGGKVNVLSVLIVISILTPAIGLAFAVWSYGVYWG